MDVHKADIIKYKRAVLNILINARATLIDRVRIILQSLPTFDVF